MQRSANRLLRKVNDFLSPGASDVPPGQLPVPDHLIPLPSPEGVTLLAGSRTAADYLRLMPYFVPQESPKFCGPATLAMGLNALHLAPAGSGKVRPRFTQRNIFTAETEAVRSRRKVKREGMGLPVLAEFATAHGARAEVRFAGNESLADFRAAAVEALADARRYLAVNYSRVALGQHGKGHTSPLAAYDADTDRFLVLDVSRTRYPPVWVRAADLFAAMNTSVGPRTRGYAIVGR
jgi:hypothetical protein